jgi:hypothetical protein
VYHGAPIQKTQNFIPQWWKDLPKPSDRMLNMRHCAGFIDYFRTGFIMPLWSEFKLTYSSGNVNYMFSDMESKATPHLPEQRGKYLPAKDYAHIKFESPWLFSSRSDIQFFMVDPVWCRDQVETYFLLPGAVDYKNQFSTNANFMFNKNVEDKTIYIKHNTPLAHFVPLTEKNVIVKNHIVDFPEYNRIKNLRVPMSFINNYKGMKKMVQDGGFRSFYDLIRK